MPRYKSLGYEFSKPAWFSCCHKAHPNRISSVLIKEVVTRNAERESFSVFITFNLLSSNPVTLQREPETILQSEITHTPQDQRLSLETEVQKELIQSVPTK